MPIILEKLKKRLFLIKNKREAKYKAEYLNQIYFFLETDFNSTAWNEFVEKLGANLDIRLPKNL